MFNCRDKASECAFSLGLSLGGSLTGFTAKVWWIVLEYFESEFEVVNRLDRRSYQVHVCSSMVQDEDGQFDSKYLYL
jgi:hypothetical protein